MSELENKISLLHTVVASLLYYIYCKEVGGRAFNGDPLPSWSEFAADPVKAKQVNAWLAVATRTIEINSLLSIINNGNNRKVSDQDGE